MPRAEQSALNLIVRTTKDTEFGGRLEPYGSSDAVEDGGIVGKMSIQMAADQLLHGETREQLLRLRKRDVLAPRPAGLDDYEWAYLIWRDQ